MERYDMNYDIFVSGAASIGGGFVMGMLIGYFLRKILKLVMFALRRSILFAGILTVSRIDYS